MQTSKYSANPLAQVLKRTCGLVGVGATLAVLSHSAFAACTYTLDNEWPDGFVAKITVKNDTAAPINGSWNANFSGSNPYTATNVAWNGSIAVGQSVSFGFQGTKNGGSAERPTV